MIKGLKLIDKALWRYGIRCCINSDENGNRCKRRDYFESSDKINVDTLYVIPKGTDNICEIIQNEGNFLTFSREGERVTERIGGRTNLIMVPEEVEITTFFQDLDACFKAMGRIRECSMDLLELASGKLTNLEVANILADIIRNPITIYSIDSETFPYYSTTEKETDALWARLVKGEIPIAEDVEVNQMIDSSDTYNLGMMTPVIFHPKGYSYKRRLIIGIWTENICRYQLTVLENRQFTEMDSALMICISDFLGETLLKSDRGRMTEEEKLIKLVESALDESADEGELLRRSMELDLIPKKSCMLCVSHKEENAAFIEFMNLFHRLYVEFRDCTVVVYKFKILVITKDNTERVCRELRKSLKKDEDEWIVTRSRNISDITGLKKAYRECRTARTFADLSQDRIFSYEEFQLQDFLYQCAKHVKPEDFLLDKAKEMVNYDKKHQTEYAVTLYYYLKSFKNKDWTADKLIVHANTVRYRVERCEELFGIDLEDYTQLASLLMSFELMRLEDFTNR